MSRNVRLYLFAEFFKSMSFAYAVSTLFYQQIGLNYTEIGLLWLAMSMAQLLFEVPCGLLSDRIGHRATVILGFIIFIFTMLCIGLGSGFWTMFLSGFLWGISAAFLSGANDAFIYETLKHEGHESAYLRIIGLRSMLASIAIILGAIPGAYLYAMHFRLPWFFNAAAIAAGSLCLLLAQSPPNIEKNDETRPNQRQHLLRSAKIFLSNRALLWLSLFVTLSTFCLYGFALIRQPYLIDRGLLITQLGFIFAAIEILSSLVSWQAHRIKNALGFSPLIGIAIVTLISTFVLLSHIHSAWSLLPLACMYAAFRLLGIVINEATNRQIPSEQRATILSIQSMGSSVLLIIFMLSSGYILDNFTLDLYLFALAVYIAVILLPLWMLRRLFSINNRELRYDH